jgi:hypothetical protein
MTKKYASGSRALGQKKYIDRVAQDHALTGRTLFELGAKSYITGDDMTWFMPEKGKLIEISKAEQASSRDQMA